MALPKDEILEMNKPSGFWQIEAYTNGYQIVVIGCPPTDLEETDSLYHNCDEMGCSSLDHVVARIPVMAPHPELDWAKMNHK